MESLFLVGSFYVIERNSILNFVFRNGSSFNLGQGNGTREYGALQLVEVAGVNIDLYYST